MPPREFWLATPHEIAAAIEMVSEIKAGPTSMDANRLSGADVAGLAAMLARAKQGPGA